MQRIFLRGVIALMGLLLWTTAPLAHAAQSPSDALRGSVDQILMTLKNPEYLQKDKRPALRAEIEREVAKIFDFTEFSKRTLGSYWKDFSAEQQQRFEKAFAELLMATYLDKVDGYNGEKVVYLGERFTQNNKLAEVQTTITLSTGQTVPVAYRMLIVNNSWRIYDVLVESVGLNSNYRAQFKDILAKSTPDELISRVEARVVELHQQVKQPS